MGMPWLGIGILWGREFSSSGPHRGCAFGVRGGGPGHCACRLQTFLECLQLASLRNPCLRVTKIELPWARWLRHSSFPYSSAKFWDVGYIAPQRNWVTHLRTGNATPDGGSRSKATSGLSLVELAQLFELAARYGVLTSWCNGLL